MNPEIKTGLVAIAQFIGLLAAGGAMIVGSLLYHFG